VTAVCEDLLLHPGLRIAAEAGDLESVAVVILAPQLGGNGPGSRLVQPSSARSVVDM